MKTSRSLVALVTRSDERLRALRTLVEDASGAEIRLAALRSFEEADQALRGETIGVAAPGKEGTWTLYISGIGSVSGVPTDPLGVTNGTSAPGTVEGAYSFERNNGFDGLTDISGHPAEGFIQAAVSDHLVDGFADGTYRPDAALTRAQLAQYLVQGAGVRQSLPHDVSAAPFGDVSAAQAPFVEAATAQGATLKDRALTDDGLIRADGSAFNPGGTVSRAEPAYSLVQGYGFEDIAAGYTGDVAAPYDGERVVLDDQGAIRDGPRGYVQLDLGLMNAYFDVEQGEFDLEPTVPATFEPTTEVTRAGYAVAATRYFESYSNVTEADATGESGGDESATTLSETQEALSTAPRSFALEGNYPNPVRQTTQIAFTLPARGAVQITVYDVLGRRVMVAADRAMSAGQHDVRVDAGQLASGTYLYRLETDHGTKTGRMTVVK